jgi:uncharacterized protein YycO
MYKLNLKKMITTILAVIAVTLGLIVNIYLFRVINRQKEGYNKLLLANKQEINSNNNLLISIGDLKEAKLQDEHSYMTHLKSLNQDRTQLRNKLLNLIDHIFDNRHNLYTVPTSGLYLREGIEGIDMFANKTVKDTLNYMPSIKFDNERFMEKESFIDYLGLKKEEGLE